VKPETLALGLVLVVAAAACGRGDTASDMELTGNGHIKISGGCECYAEGTITLRPASGGNVEVEVDNSRAWFYEDNEPLGSFKVEMEVDEVGEFFADLREVLDNPAGTDTCSTRAAVIEVYLPFRDGTVVETTWRELDMKRDVNPLVDLLEEFVEECHDEL